MAPLQCYKQLRWAVVTPCLVDVNCDARHLCMFFFRLAELNFSFSAAKFVLCCVVASVLGSKCDNSD